MSRRPRGPLDRVANPLTQFEAVLRNFQAVAGSRFGLDGVWILLVEEGKVSRGGHWGGGPERLLPDLAAPLEAFLASRRAIPGRPVLAGRDDPDLWPVVERLEGGCILAARLRLQGWQPFMYADLGLQVEQELLLVAGGLPEGGISQGRARALVLLAQQSLNLAYVGMGLAWTGNLATGLFQLSPYGMVRKAPGPGYVFNRQAATIAGLDAGGSGSVRRLEDLFPSAGRVGLTRLVQEVESGERTTGEIEFFHPVSGEDRRVRVKVTYLDIGPDQTAWALTPWTQSPEGEVGNYWVIIGLEDVTERVRQQRVDRELELAQEVQARLMPERIPRVPGLEIAVFSASASEMNGDFYDLLPRDGRGLVAAVGDVSGHGIPAALGMAMAKSALHTALQKDWEIQAVLGRINATLVRLTDSRTFVTLCLAWIDPGAGELVLTAGGHPPAIHFSARTGRTEFLELVAYPAGVKGSTRFPTHRRAIGPGDLLVFYSDGIVEALSPDEEVFGYERLADLVHRESGGGVAAIRDALAEELERFHGHRPRDDDQTLIVVRLTPKR